jgi:hypothetical protein
LVNCRVLAEELEVLAGATLNRVGMANAGDAGIAP